LPLNGYKTGRPIRLLLPEYASALLTSRRMAYSAGHPMSKFPLQPQRESRVSTAQRWLQKVIIGSKHYCDILAWSSCVEPLRPTLARTATNRYMGAKRQIYITTDDGGKSTLTLSDFLMLTIGERMRNATKNEYI